MYHYAGNNPVTYTDPDGEFADIVWDAFSLATGVISLVSDIREGNVTAATIDALGVVADAAAIAIPFVPGGAGNAIKALRTIETSEQKISFHMQHFLFISSHTSPLLYRDKGTHAISFSFGIVQNMSTSIASSCVPAISCIMRMAVSCVSGSLYALRMTMAE